MMKEWKLIGWGVTALALLFAILALSETKRERDAEKAAHAETIANYRLAQEAAKAIAERHRRDLEDLSRRNADEAEDRYAEGLADAGARAEQFIAANRVRQVQCVGSPTSGAATAAQGERASVPAPVSDSTLVGVTAEDVRACTAAAQYALSAHEWAKTLAQP
jgi:hypothetical protein